MTGRKALGVGMRIPGVRGGHIGGSRCRTPSRALAASSWASNGRPESGGERHRDGGGDGREGGAVEGTGELSSASALLLKEGTLAAKGGGLGKAPASGPRP
jgi:hypothetical protein